MWQGESRSCVNHATKNSLNQLGVVGAIRWFRDHRDSVAEVGIGRACRRHHLHHASSRGATKWAERCDALAAAQGLGQG